MSDTQQEKRETQTERGPQARQELQAQQEPPVVESASATTSPENSSGAAPFVIVGVVLACLIFLAAGVGNLVGSLGALAASRGGYYADDLDELLDELEGEGYGTGAPDANSRGRSRGGNTELTQDYALSYDYQFLAESVSDYVFASDYTGAQQSVASYVKALSKLDGDALAQVQSHVRAAAATSDAATRSSELAQAAKVCEDAQAKVSQLAVPTAGDIAGSQATSIAGDLADARDDVAERWKDIGRIVALMDDPSGHRTGELAELDDDASDVTDIAIELTDALTTSASHSK